MKNYLTIIIYLLLISLFITGCNLGSKKASNPDSEELEERNSDYYTEEEAYKAIEEGAANAEVVETADEEESDD